MKGVLLCVDDEIIVLHALKDQLRRAFGSKYIIETAESGKEGLEILDELAEYNLLPLVILSDWLMPGMKGDDFLIAAHQRFPKVITVMLSGQTDSTAVDRAREQANLHDFIHKPWDGAMLVSCIKQCLMDYKSAS